MAPLPKHAWDRFKLFMGEGCSGRITMRAVDGRVEEFIILERTVLPRGETVLRSFTPVPANAWERFKAILTAGAPRTFVLEVFEGRVVEFQALEDLLSAAESGDESRKNLDRVKTA